MAFFIFLAVIFLVAPGGCAHLQKPVSTGPGAGRKVVMMTAKSYKFTPNNIRAAEGDVIVFSIKNISSVTHDFTLKDPEGRKIADRDLPAGKTTVIKAAFPEAGIYEFYCDIDFHAALGMKGRVVVGGK